jgi:RNA polymerase sigma-70 factor, ECF subfamily
MINIFKFKRKKNADELRRDRYEGLVKSYSSDLYRYAYWLCNDQHIAEDLVQDTYLRAWRFIDNLEDDKAAKQWLLTILRRENARRFEKKQLELVDIDDYDIEDKADNDEQHQWLHMEIMKLSKEYREPLLMQTMMGFTGEEIADILCLNNSTVMTRLARAKKQLKSRVNHQGGMSYEKTRLKKY